MVGGYVIFSEAIAQNIVDFVLTETTTTKIKEKNIYNYLKDIITTGKPILLTSKGNIGVVSLYNISYCFYSAEPSTTGLLSMSFTFADPLGDTKIIILVGFETAPDEVTLVKRTLGG